MGSFARMPGIKVSSFARMQEVNANLLSGVQKSVKRLDSPFLFEFMMIGFVLLLLLVIIMSAGLNKIVQPVPATGNHANVEQSKGRSTTHPTYPAHPAERPHATTQPKPAAVEQSDGSATSYVAVARQAASSAGIDPDLFVRQIQQESGFNPNAISPAGAIGIAQFMPATAAQWGIDPHNPGQSLRAAARYMAHYSASYGGDYAKALAAYNGGPGCVNYAVNMGGSNWIAYLPAETQNYIHVILN